MHKLLRIGITCDNVLALFVLEQMNDIYKLKKIEWDPDGVQKSEWRQLQVVFVNDLCTQVFNRIQDRNTFVTLLGLTLRNAHEALALPCEMVYIVVGLLEKIWAKEAKSVVKLGEHLLPDLIAKLLIKRYDDFFTQDKLLFNFVSHVYSEIYEEVDNNLKRDLIYVLTKTIDRLDKFVQQTPELDKQQQLINDLILFYSVLDVVYVDSEIEQCIKKEFTLLNQTIKELVDKRAVNGWEKVPRIDELVKLLKG